MVALCNTDVYNHCEMHSGVPLAASVVHGSNYLVAQHLLSCFSLHNPTIMYMYVSPPPRQARVSTQCDFWKLERLVPASDHLLTTSICSYFSMPYIFIYQLISDWCAGLVWPLWSSRCIYSCGQFSGSSGDTSMNNHK
jgi:hypothetical protein